MFSGSTSESASTVLNTESDNAGEGAPLTKQLCLADCNRRTVSSAGNHRPSGAEISQHGLLPFNLVALPECRQLVTGLQPGSTVISRDTVRKRMAEGVVGMKKTICSLVSHDRLGVNDD